MFSCFNRIKDSSPWQLSVFRRISRHSPRNHRLNRSLTNAAPTPPGVTASATCNPALFRQIVGAALQPSRAALAAATIYGVAPTIIVPPATSATSADTTRLPSATPFAIFALQAVSQSGALPNQNPGSEPGAAPSHYSLIFLIISISFASPNATISDDLYSSSPNRINTIAPFDKT